MILPFDYLHSLNLKNLLTTCNLLGKMNTFFTTPCHDQSSCKINDFFLVFLLHVILIAMLWDADPDLIIPFDADPDFLIGDTYPRQSEASLQHGHTGHPRLKDEPSQIHCEPPWLYGRGSHHG
jgi:hypothetical protein